MLVYVLLIVHCFLTSHINIFRSLRNFLAAIEAITLDDLVEPTQVISYCVAKQFDGHSYGWRIGLNMKLIVNKIF